MPRWFRITATCGASLVVAAIVATWLPVPRLTPQWGVTFNAAYATYLGLDWQETFLAARDELGVQRWRLSVPWDEVEAQPGTYDFSQTDWLLDKAQQTGGQVILAIGRRTPRWPECHDPAWVAPLSEAAQQDATLALLAAVVQRYRSHPAVAAWQVENEVNLELFGKCPAGDMAYYGQEVALVRSLDTAHRPITTAVSGELSRWGGVARLVDQVGTSVYRTTYSKAWGYFTYPYPSLFYRTRAWLTQSRTGKPVFISELQMEPWGRLPLVQLDVHEQLEQMSPAQGRRNLYLARQTGLDPVYLWGVEWWYWLKVRHGETGWWDAMQQTFAGGSLLR